MFVIASFIERVWCKHCIWNWSSSPGGLTPVKLALAGATISALLGAISSGIALYFNLAQEVSMWNAGGVAGVKWQSINMLVPIGLVCLLSQL